MSSTRKTFQQVNKPTEPELILRLQKENIYKNRESNRKNEINKNRSKNNIQNEIIHSSTHGLIPCYQNDGHIYPFPPYTVPPNVSIYATNRSVLSEVNIQHGSTSDVIDKLITRLYSKYIASQEITYDELIEISSQIHNLYTQIAYNETYGEITYTLENTQEELIELKQQIESNPTEDTIKPLVTSILESLSWLKSILTTDLFYCKLYFPGMQITNIAFMDEVLDETETNWTLTSRNLHKIKEKGNDIFFDTHIGPITRKNSGNIVFFSDLVKNLVNQNQGKQITILFHGGQCSVLGIMSPPSDNPTAFGTTGRGVTYIDEILDPRIKRLLVRQINNNDTGIKLPTPRDGIVTRSITNQETTLKPKFENLTRLLSSNLTGTVNSIANPTLKQQILSIIPITFYPAGGYKSKSNRKTKRRNNRKSKRKTRSNKKSKRRNNRKTYKKRR